MGGEIALATFTPDNAFWVVPTIPVVTAALHSRPTRDFIRTGVFALIAMGTYMLVGWAFILPFRLWPDLVPRVSPEELRVFVARLDDVGAIIACPVMLGLLWAGTRIAGQPFSDYLALRWPSRREIVRGLLATFALLVIAALVGYLTGESVSDFGLNEYRSAKDSWWLLVLLIAMCVTAPLTEELVVRGFLFRGWSQSFLGPTGSIVVTSVLWAVLHTQYDLFYRLVIFAHGLMLGYFRYRSGSTWLTVIIHSATNLASVVEMAFFLG